MATAVRVRIAQFVLYVAMTVVGLVLIVDGSTTTMKALGSGLSLVGLLGAVLILVTMRKER
jgi:hypothetical protein